MEVFHTAEISESDFDQIVSTLHRGGVIGFPTDTSYGLGADAFNSLAIDRLFQIKGRADTKAILVLVDSMEMAASITHFNPSFRQVAEKFWPGPLTLIIPADPRLPLNLTGGTGAIGVRWPAASFASTLVHRFGKPITATSANRSGMPSSVTVAEVRAQLGDTVDVLIDGGRLPHRQGSTLLDLTVDPPVVLREGPISFEILHEFFHGRILRKI